MAYQRPVPFIRGFVLNLTDTSQRVSPSGSVVNIMLSPYVPPEETPADTVRRQRMVPGLGRSAMMFNQSADSQRVGPTGFVINDRLTTSGVGPSPTVRNRRLSMVGVGGNL